MKHFFISLLAVLVGGGILLFLPILFLVAIASTMSTTETIPVKKGSVLTIDLTEKINDRNMDGAAYRMRNILSGADMSTGLDAIADKLEKAGEDDNISALLLTGAYVNVQAPAALSELRSSIQYFRKMSGKPVYYFSNNASTSALYIASACDSVFLVPEGGIDLEGFKLGKMYLKSFFDKYGIHWDVIKHGKYKSAVEPYFRDSMSDEDRAQSQRIVDVIWEDFKDTIATGRGIETTVLDSIVDNLVSISCKANYFAKVGLISNAIYYDQLLDKLRSVCGKTKDETVELVNIKDYNKNNDDDINSLLKKDNNIAIVYAIGEIKDGNTDDPSTIYGDALAETLRDVREDTTIKAVVLRVNSPGGSALASDIIWREMTLLKAEKPVVVSMGDYAASGGYYISCAANYIFAEPTTLTGSIGVYGAIPSVEGLAKNNGISFDIVSSNKNPYPQTIMGVALANGLNADQISAITRNIENTYSTFVSRVAEGRGRSSEYIDSIGQGRVWMGIDGVKMGLVDGIGNLDDAIDYAAEMAALDDYDTMIYPEIDNSPMAAFKELGITAKLGIGHILIGEEYDKLMELRDQAENNKISTVQALCDYKFFMR